MGSPGRGGGRLPFRIGGSILLVLLLVFVPLVLDKRALKMDEEDGEREDEEGDKNREGWRRAEEEDERTPRITLPRNIIRSLEEEMSYILLSPIYHYIKQKKIEADHKKNKNFKILMQN